MRKLFIPLAFLALFSLISCNKSTSDSSTEPKKEADNKPKAEVKAVRVRISPLTRGDIASIIETTSNIEAESLVDVFPKVPGIISELFVEEGDNIKPGQILARIEDKEFRIRESQSEVAYREAVHQKKQTTLNKEEADQRESQARNNADQAKRDFERNRNLAAASEQGKTSLISQKDLENSKLAWEKAEGDYQVARFAAKKAAVDLESTEIAVEKAKLAWDLAKLQLSDCEIKSRNSGVVSFRGIRAGETVTAGSRAFTVVELDQLITNFYRPQKELRYLSSQIPLEAICEAFPDKTFRGTVLRVNPVVDPSSGTFKVTARIDNPERLLRHGMLIRTKITTSLHPNAYLVPKKAIFYEGDKPIVFAHRDGIAVRVPLEAGFSDPDRIEVLNISDNGLRSADQIIVIGNAELRDGTKVEVVDG